MSNRESDREGGWDSGWGGWAGGGWPHGRPGGWHGRWPGDGPGRGARPGPPPWIQDLVRHFGGPEFGPPRGPRARRGDVRSAILDVLAGDELNGYQVIQQISDRTGGSWKPSPGSVYPTIQQLEDEGLVEAHETEGRRLLRLTDEGRRYVEDHADEMAATWAPFEHPAPDQAPGGSGERPSDLKPVIGQVMGAMWQVMSTGTPAQRRQAADILVETRRKLYGLLAEGDPERD